MTAIPSPSASPLVTTVQETGTRQTPPTAGQQFRAALENAAGGLLAGVEQAAGLVPGGSLVGAAIRPDSGLGMSPEAPTGGLEAGPSLDGALSAGTDQTMALLGLQQRMSMEQRHYMALSNALKARHDTAKNVLGNVR